MVKAVVKAAKDVFGDDNPPPAPKRSRRPAPAPVIAAAATTAEAAQPVGAREDEPTVKKTATKKTERPAPRTKTTKRAVATPEENGTGGEAAPARRRSRERSADRA